MKNRSSPKKKSPHCRFWAWIHPCRSNKCHWQWKKHHTRSCSEVLLSRSTSLTTQSVGSDFSQPPCLIRKLCKVAPPTNNRRSFRCVWWGIFAATSSNKDEVVGWDLFPTVSKYTIYTDIKPWLSNGERYGLYSQNELHLVEWVGFGITWTIHVRR